MPFFIPGFENCPCRMYTIYQTGGTFMKAQILAAGLMIISLNCIYSFTTVNRYSTMIGTNRQLSSIEIKKLNAGYLAEPSVYFNTNGTRMDYLLDNSFATVEWNLSIASNNTKVKAVREGNTIRISGTNNGKPYDKTESVDQDPWFQEWLSGCAESVRKGRKEFYFYSFNPSDITLFTKFKGTFLKEETLLIHGGQIEAYRYKLGLTGLLEPFWSANYWYRKSDGNFIRCEMKMPNNTPLVSELVSESNL
jgi:hypothetical protein